MKALYILAIAGLTIACETDYHSKYSGEYEFIEVSENFANGELKTNTFNLYLSKDGHWEYFQKDSDSSLLENGKTNYYWQGNENEIRLIMHLGLIDTILKPTDLGTIKSNKLLQSDDYITFLEYEKSEQYANDLKTPAFDTVLVAPFSDTTKFVFNEIDKTFDKSEISQNGQMKVLMKLKKK